jgi:hypothetical protein
MAGATSAADTPSGMAVAELSPARLMTSPLGVNVLGTDLGADLYLRNGFRFLALPACADSDELETAIGRLRSRMKIGGDRVLKSQSIRLGYDDFAPCDDVFDCVDQLRNPKRRLLCEIFWPHLDGELFGHIRDARQLTSPPVMEALSAASQQGNGLARSLAGHALAVCLHNKAIWDEMAHISKGQPWSNTTWAAALRWWGSIIHDDTFWEYLHERVKGYDDIQVRKEDLRELRERLPHTLLAFNAVLARSYGRVARSNTGAHGAPPPVPTPFIKRCNGHLGIINASPLSMDAKREAVTSIVNALVTSALDPVRERTKRTIVEQTKRFEYKAFRKRCDPLVKEALDVYEYLRRDVGLTPKMLSVAEFDQFCETILDCINSKLEYKSDDRERALLYGLIVCKRMLALPISGPTRLKLEQLINEHHKHLYTDVSLPIDFDASLCFFQPGQEADPDECLSLPLYKITDSRGASVRWATRNVLVPRSRLAAQFHRGKIDAKEIERLVLAENEPLRLQFEELKREEQTKIAEIDKRLNLQLKGIEVSSSKRLQELNSRSATDESKAKDHIAKQNEKERRLFAESEARLQTEIRTVEDEYKPKLEPLETQFQAQTAGLRGWEGASRIELPYCLGAAAGLSPIGFGAAYAVQLPLAFSLVVAATTGVGIGLYVSRRLRRSKLTTIREPLTRLEEKARQKQEERRKQHQERVDVVRRAAAESRKPAEAWLAQLEQARAAIASKRASAISSANHEATNNKNQITSSIASRRKPLENQIRAKLNPRKESDKREFVPYKMLKGKGFSDGEKPSDSELERIAQREFDDFMSGLTPMDRAILQLAANVLSKDDFARFLGGLMELPAAERRERLNDLKNKLTGLR